MIEQNLFPEPLSILTTPRLQTVEHQMVQSALRLALLGRIDAARQIVEHLYSRPMLQKLEATGLRTLVGFWRLTRFPAGIPESMRTDKYFDDLKSEDISWPHYVAEKDRKEDEAGLAAVLSELPEHRWYRSLTLRKALDLAAKLAEERGVGPAKDAKVQEILATIAEGLPSSMHDKEIVQIPRCWPLFASGAVAQALEITDQELSDCATELPEAFGQRYLHGPAQQSATTVPELMQTCNDLTVVHNDHRRIEMDEDGPETLFEAPASEEDILNLEKALEIELPDDFKIFLRHSNGFGGIWNGYFPGPPIESTEKIAWLDYAEYELTYYQLTLPHDVTSRRNPETGLYEDLLELPIFDDVVLIASLDIDDVWLIPPKLMQQVRESYKKLYELADDHGKQTIERAVEDFAGSWEEWEKSEWGCTYWASGGSVILENYKSFTAWLAAKAWEARHAGSKQA